MRNTYRLRASTVWYDRFRGDGDGEVTLAEVGRYLDEEMTYQSKRLFGAAREQRATAIGDRDFVLVSLPAEPLPEHMYSAPVTAPGDADYGTARLVLADLVDPANRYHHDPERLASAVMRLYYERDLRERSAPAAGSARR